MRSIVLRFVNSGPFLKVCNPLGASRYQFPCHSNGLLTHFCCCRVQYICTGLLHSQTAHITLWQNRRGHRPVSCFLPLLPNRTICRARVSLCECRRPQEMHAHRLPSLVCPSEYPIENASRGEPLFSSESDCPGQTHMVGQVP